MADRLRFMVINLLAELFLFRIWCKGEIVMCWSYLNGSMYLPGWATWGGTRCRTGWRSSEPVPAALQSPPHSAQSHATSVQDGSPWSPECQLGGETHTSCYHQQRTSSVRLGNIDHMKNTIIMKQCSEFRYQHWSSVSIWLDFTKSIIN